MVIQVHYVLLIPRLFDDIHKQDHDELILSPIHIIDRNDLMHELLYKVHNLNKIISLVATSREGTAGAPALECGWVSGPKVRSLCGWATTCG
jgi:hypothetical protein